MPANLENSAVATGHRPQEKVNFHSEMGTIKDRNDLDLTEGDDIKKRWQ